MGCGTRSAAAPQHPNPGPGGDISSPHPVLESILLASSGEAPEPGNEAPPRPIEAQGLQRDVSAADFMRQ